MTNAFTQSNMTVSAKNERLFWSLDDAERFVATSEQQLRATVVRTYEDREHFAALLEQCELLSQRIAIENGLRQFAVNATNRQWQTAEHFAIDLVNCWRSLLELVCANYERPLDERLCSDVCLHIHHSVVRLSHTINIYGCTLHGTLHYCDGRTCRAQMTNSNWMIVCLFSGTEIGRHLAQVSSIADGYRESGGAGGGRAAFRNFAAHEQHGNVVDSFHNSAVDAPSAADADLWREQI